MGAEGSDTGRDLLKAGMAATDAGDYRKGYDTLRSFYGEKLEPVDGLSHLGLCVAVIEKQTRKGMQLCKAALKAQFYEPAHHINLIKLYLERDDRKNAVKALEQALRQMPRNAEINRLRATIRYRKRARPMFPFLSRDNPINVILGKIRAVLWK
jgi:tetratricopeptide (TPR) repeat protein